MKELQEKLKNANIPFLVEEPLKKWCSFKVGGNAELLVVPTSKAQLVHTLKEIAKRNIPYFILGEGTNILFSDSGLRAVVIRTGIGLADMWMLSDEVIYCESGAKLASLCRFALQNNLAGMEELYGIPGSVGGAIYMNAGAYGGEIKNVVTMVDYVNPNGDTGIIQGDNLELSYRHSVFKDRDSIITGAAFKLSKGDAGVISAKMDDYMNRRISKQPLDFPSGGSTFKRPPNGYASALIDECGLKGARVGDAMVSEKHAGFVINAGNATSKDVLGVIEKVKSEVLRQKGVKLECEIIIL